MMSIVALGILILLSACWLLRSFLARKQDPSKEREIARMEGWLVDAGIVDEGDRGLRQIAIEALKSQQHECGERTTNV